MNLNELKVKFIYCKSIKRMFRSAGQEQMPEQRKVEGVDRLINTRRDVLLKGGIII